MELDRKQRGFMRRVARALKRAGFDDVRPHPEEFALEVGTAFVQLGNIHESYLATAFGLRWMVVKQFVRALQESPKEPLDLDLDLARPLLLPRIRERFFHAALELRNRRTEQAVPPFAVRRLDDHHDVEVVLDCEETILTLPIEQLDKWGMSFDEALDIARENLWERSDEAFVEVDRGVFRSPWQDCYDTTRALLHPLIHRLPVKGAPVVTLAHRDALFVTGARDEDGLRSLVAHTRKELDQARVMSPIPLVLTDDGYTTLTLPLDHVAYADVRGLELGARQRDHAEQEEMMRDLVERGVYPDVWVATYQLMQTVATGELCSNAIWTEGVQTYLPEADQVTLVRRTGEGKDDLETCGVVQWAQFRETLGERVTPIDVFPPRFDAKEFPSEEERADWSA